MNFRGIQFKMLMISLFFPFSNYIQNRVGSFSGWLFLKIKHNYSQCNPYDSLEPLQQFSWGPGSQNANSPDVLHSSTGTPMSKSPARTGAMTSPPVTPPVRAVVLHAGVNDIRKRQSVILKRDFRRQIEEVHRTSPSARSIVSWLLPMYRQGHEWFSRLFALN